MYNQDNLDKKKPTPFPLYQSQTNDIPYNWNIDNMPWKSQNDNNVMMFNGVQCFDCDPFSATSNRAVRKRKNEIASYSPSKQHISESKMAAFLNGLHISSDYQAHSINLTDRSFDDDMEAAYNVNLSPQELEERLKNAQKIVLCDDVKKTLQENSKNEMYKVLADRLEKPCRALVLWQPPRPIEKLLTDFNTPKCSNDSNKKDKNEEEEKMIME